MSGNVLDTALSGLLSQQRALSTTSHNIANAQTPGYSRQRVDLVTREPQLLSNGTLGTGVRVANVQRIYDQFVVSEIRSSTSAFGQLETFHSLSSQVDNILADPNSGITSALSQFFGSLQELADNPSSISSRQVVLSEAQSLVGRLDNLDRYFDTFENNINTRMSAEVGEINGLTRRIAALNNEIAEATGSGISANDLLDARDRAVQELSGLIGISTVEQTDGSLNIFFGTGQSLVQGVESYDLATQTSIFGEGRTNVTLNVGTGTREVDDLITGGSLGGVLSFRSEVLDEARYALGRVVYGLTEAFNEQHRSGSDLNGLLGGDFFTSPSPSAVSPVTNAGNAVATATISDVSALKPTDYLLKYNGASWDIFDKSGNLQTATGSGTAADPFIVGGVSIEITGAPVDKDQILVRSTSTALGGVGLALNDPSRIAAAAPIRTSVDTGNTGSGQISNGEVIDVSDPNLLVPAQITFLNATTYQINGSGSFAYSPGSNIDINGSRVVITGTPEAGDTFTIEPNSGGVGDNRNALRLAAIETEGVLDGGTSDLASAALVLVSQVAITSRNAAFNRDSQETILNQSIERRESVSGVNLDEEAANLIRHQQAFSAAAQAVSVAREMFNQLFQATR